jgi:hypothetical protein
MYITIHSAGIWDRKNKNKQWKELSQNDKWILNDKRD